MKAFMDKDFLLQTPTARQLYHSYAADRPVYDYHCHINPAEIAENKQFRSITEAWLGGDHYKWRLMRAGGVDERLITGDGGDREKFRAFASCLDKAAGNPVYHWAHLELQRYFDYYGVLSAATADEVFDLCNQKLGSFRVQDMIRKSNVMYICTTDDPCDDLSAHAEIAASGFEVKVAPGWRPDKAVGILNHGFTDYIKLLSRVSGVDITDMDSLFAALSARLDFFHAAGCRISDHGLDFVPCAPRCEQGGARALTDMLAGRVVTADSAEAYRYAVLQFLFAEYCRRSWIAQIHYGPLRNTNSRKFKDIGADSGFDVIGHAGDAHSIAGFLDALECAERLPKTVLYSINPNDNAMLTSVMGSFQSGLPGKLQHGSAWWYNDTKSGMEAQLTNLAEQGLLGNFIGMLTDSRSFLSYTRHEYFRRILCNLIGDWIESGQLPADIPHAGSMIADICCENIKQYIQA